MLDFSYRRRYYSVLYPTNHVSPISSGRKELASGLMLRIEPPAACVWARGDLLGAYLATVVAGTVVEAYVGYISDCRLQAWRRLLVHLFGQAARTDCSSTIVLYNHGTVTLKFSCRCAPPPPPFSRNERMFSKQNTNKKKWSTTYKTVCIP